MLVHRPGIFQPGEAEAEGLRAGVQPGLPRETVVGNHRLGCGLVTKGLPRVDKALAVRWGEGRRMNFSTVLPQRPGGAFH